MSKKKKQRMDSKVLPKKMRCANYSIRMKKMRTKKRKKKKTKIKKKKMLKVPKISQVINLPKTKKVIRRRKKRKRRIKIKSPVMKTMDLQVTAVQIAQDPN